MADIGSVHPYLDDHAWRPARPGDGISVQHHAAWHASRQPPVGRGFALDLGTVRTRTLSWDGFAIADRLSAVPAGPSGACVSTAGLTWPIRRGMVTDPAACQRLVHAVLHDARQSGAWPPERLLVGVPVTATPSDRRALRIAVLEATGCGVMLVDEPLAAALGAGLDVTDPRPCLLLDVGAGIVEAAVIRDGAIADAAALRLSAVPRPGLPADPVDGVVQMTAGLLGRVPYRLRPAARDNGLLLTGGGARQARLLHRLRAALRMPISTAPEPAHATIRGLMRLCEQPALAARITARGR